MLCVFQGWVSVFVMAVLISGFNFLWTELLCMSFEAIDSRPATSCFVPAIVGLSKGLEDNVVDLHSWQSRKTVATDLLRHRRTTSFQRYEERS